MIQLGATQSVQSKSANDGVVPGCHRSLLYFRGFFTLFIGCLEVIPVNCCSHSGCYEGIMKADKSRRHCLCRCPFASQSLSQIPPTEHPLLQVYGFYAECVRKYGDATVGPPILTGSWKAPGKVISWTITHLTPAG